MLCDRREQTESIIAMDMCPAFEDDLYRFVANCSLLITNSS